MPLRLRLNRGLREKWARIVEDGLADALTFEAFSSEYIAHLIQARGRQLPQPSPLVLLRRQDVLDLELPPPDLSLYGTEE